MEGRLAEVGKGQWRWAFPWPRFSPAAKIIGEKKEPPTPTTLNANQVDANGRSGESHYLAASGNL